MSIILTKPEDIQYFRLLALRTGVKMEMLGMRRRGRSARTAAVETLGLPARATRQQVYDALSAVIDKY